jgi:chlorobactene glucosyltransferase
MAGYLTQDLIQHLIVFQAIILLIIMSNAINLHRAEQHAVPRIYPMVSILVPARNEARNIARCVNSLLAQDYPSFELIVYDDQSSDATREILAGIASQQPGLKVVVGGPLPEGRMGKGWACSQLARQASGELLLFTDADTQHHPQTLRRIVTVLNGEAADLLSGFPCQKMASWGERLLVPFFSWAVYCLSLIHI